MTARRYHVDGAAPVGDGWMFVFGSNLAGRHGAGAARFARQKFDAQYGVGSGPTGRSYAIPTKDGQLRVIRLAAIGASIGQFLDYAEQHPDQKFFVTRVGCGLAGYLDREIAPFFKAAPANCSLPDVWRQFIEAP